MAEGRIVGEFSGEAMTEENLIDAVSRHLSPAGTPDPAARSVAAQ
jgi:hypothetical protein